LTDTIVRQSTAPAASPGLFARVAGVVFSPRTTYARIVERPQSLGVLVLITVVASVAMFAFLSTEVGTKALTDAQLARMESFGRPMSDADFERFERLIPFFRYIVPGTLLLSIPGLTLVFAAVGLAIFNAGLGGNASFGQVFAIVAHSEVLVGLQTLFVLPLNYATGSMAGSTSLAVFLPMLDEAGFLARLLGQIDLFRIWWVVSLAIGFGVLYKRKTSPIAWSFLATYGVIALVIAGIMAALSGA
jgi:hypothetical protein